MPTDEDLSKNLTDVKQSYDFTEIVNIEVQNFTGDESKWNIICSANYQNTFN